jgi:serine/threonine protein kinase
MSMNLSDAENIFHRALEFDSPAQRAGYLEGACGTNAELRAAVERLLQAHAGAEAAFPTEPGDRTEYVHVSEGPGAVIGKYKLLQKLGEGGMGVVYMADQTVPFDKRVALKIIKLGMDTRAVVARFEAERQALALMNHPNIAKVLDAGATETGRPYFVMELVKGMPITEYCDKQKLSTRQRLELFIPVCQAIQHAHQKGIIHRDIKPSNILVALFDGRPVPMVIDFGIAKATNQRLTQQTVFTNLGQLIGTPAYMSPEQAEGSQLDIDTRSDIYSLGVLLYELLTGTQPFPEQRLRSAGWAGMVKIILEEEPQKPSTRISTLTAEEQSQVAGTHNEPPRKISLVLRRELDWIVMACLQKDRNQRYETANGLALDIARYLRGDAPEKAPPKWSYQLSKFARKHKKTVAMAAVIAVILAGATVVSTWQAIRAMRAEEAQRKESQFAKTLNDFLLMDLLAISDAWADNPRGAPRRKDLTLLEAVEAAEKLVAERFKQHPETEARLRFIIGKALAGLGNYSAAKSNMQRVHELYLGLPAYGPGHRSTLETQYELSLLIPATTFGTGSQGREEDRARALAAQDEGLQLIDDAAEKSWEHLGPEDPLTMLLNADAAMQMARIAKRPANPDRARLMQKADQFHRRALESSARMAQRNDPALISKHLFARYALTSFLFYQQRYPEVFAESRRLVEEEERWQQQHHPDGQFRVHHAEVLYTVGMSEYPWNRDYATAEALFKRALSISEPQVGPSHPTGEIHKRLANMHHDKGDHEAARRAMMKSVRCIYDGKEQPEYAAGMAQVGAAYMAATGDWRGTLAALTELRERWPVTAPVLAREIVLRHLLGETNGLPELRQRFWQDAATRELPREALALLSMPCPPAETNLLTSLVQRAWNDGTDHELAGILAFREEDWAEATNRLTQVLQAPLPNYYLAMSRYRLDDHASARASLDRAGQLFEQSLNHGLLLRGPFDVQTSFNAALVLQVRDEAEHMILSTPVQRQPFAEWLAEKRIAWEPVRQQMEAADWAARKHNYPLAGRLHAELEQLPAFSFSTARDLGWPVKMLTVAWALGQTNRHIEILSRMHADFSDHESPHLYQLAEPSWELPRALAVRRRECAQRKDLEARWRDQHATVQGEDAFLLGMLWYREANGERALLEKSLLALDRVKDEVTFTIPTAGRAFAAMAHWKLGNEAEARRLLQAADTRFHQTILEPIPELYQPDFPTCIMMEMVIKEADELIDPDVVNAPHVAALPPDGWPQ